MPGRLVLPLLLQLLHVDLHVVFERVGGIENDPVGRFQTLQNLKRGAVVAADGELLQMCCVIGVDDDNAEAFGAEEQSVDGNDEMFAGCFHSEMNLRVAAWKEFAGFVGHIDFGVESAAGEVDRVGGADDSTFEAAAGILHKFERRSEARANIWSVDFGHADVSADRIGLREIEKSLACATVAGVDQISGIDVALREHAAEGRVDVLERFEFFEAADVGFGRGGCSFFRGVVADGVVDFLFGDAIGLDQFLKAVRCDFRKVFIRFRGAEVGFRLRELLIDFGCVDVGEEFAFFHTGADVVIPANEIAAGARVDRRVDVSLRRRREDEIFLAGRDGRMNDLHVGHGHLFGFAGERFELSATRK